jgi:hypothetical protein
MLFEIDCVSALHEDCKIGCGMYYIAGSNNVDPSMMPFIKAPFAVGIASTTDFMH